MYILIGGAQGTGKTTTIESLVGTKKVIWTTPLRMLSDLRELNDDHEFVVIQEFTTPFDKEVIQFLSQSEIRIRAPYERTARLQKMPTIILETNLSLKSVYQLLTF